MPHPPHGARKPKVVLVRPPLIRPVHHLTALETFPPLHLAYLYAALVRSGAECLLIDGQASHKTLLLPDQKRVVVGLTVDEIVARIPLDADVIGVNCMYTYTWFYDQEIVRRIRARVPGALIVAGGEHASACSLEILRECRDLSAVVVGEGERVLPPLVRHVLEGLEITELPGVVRLDAEGLPVTSAAKARLEEIDEILPPDWSGIDLEFYFSKGSGITQKKKRSLPMIASRGCPHACTFCTVSSMWDSRWIGRSPESVIDEMSDLIRTYRVEHIDFIDLTFVTSRSWIEKFLLLLEARRLPVTWALPIGTRSEALSPKLISKMKEMGLTHIMFSAESASKETLKAIKKRLNVNHLTECLEAAVEAGLIVKLVFVNGFPGQKWRDIRDNWRYILRAARIGVHDVVSLGFVPYPGSELYDQLRAEGKLGDGFTYIQLNNDLKSMKSWSDSISSRSLRWISFVSMAGFYGAQFILKPMRFLKITWRLLNQQPANTNFELIIFNRITAGLSNLLRD